MFYNTIHQTGDQLDLFKKNNVKQDDKIYTFFTENPDKTFTPFEVQNEMKMRNVPITSIRRAMNSLTRKGMLIKTDEQRLGEYGKVNYCWKLA